MMIYSAHNPVLLLPPATGPSLKEDLREEEKYNATLSVRHAEQVGTATGDVFYVNAPSPTAEHMDQPPH